jgi:signal peptidase I
MFFQKRRLSGLRRECYKEIARTRKYMQSDPTMLGPAPRSGLDAAIARLDLTSRNEQDPRMLAGELESFRQDIKEIKQSVDATLPIWRKSIVREYAEAIVIALVLALFIRAFIVQAFKIPSGSMIPTLLIGDHLIVNKFIYGFEVPFTLKKVLPFRKPERGEIVVFRYPEDTSKDFIKRVVGVPGDHISIVNKRLWINGEEIPRWRVGPFSYSDTQSIPEEGVLYEENLNGHVHKILHADFMPTQLDNYENIVPEGKYFCMGDNRDRSNDSRVWGFVDFNLIRGKAMIIYFSWPPGQWGRILSLTR